MAGARQEAANVCPPGRRAGESVRDRRGDLAARVGLEGAIAGLDNRASSPVRGNLPPGRPENPQRKWDVRSEK